MYMVWLQNSLNEYLTRVNISTSRFEINSCTYTLLWWANPAEHLFTKIAWVVDRRMYIYIRFIMGTRTQYDNVLLTREWSWGQHKNLLFPSLSVFFWTSPEPLQAGVTDWRCRQTTITSSMKAESGKYYNKNCTIHIPPILQ